MSFLGKLFGGGKPEPKTLNPSGEKKVYYPTHGVKKADSKNAQKFGPKKD